MTSFRPLQKRRRATILELSALCLVACALACPASQDDGGTTTAQAQRESAEGNGEGTPANHDGDDGQPAGEDIDGVGESDGDGGDDQATSGEDETGGEPGEVAVVAAPEGYGVFKFPEPTPGEADLPLYGMAGYEVVAVYAKPNKESEKFGFLRIGTRLRVGPAIKNEDCPSGWHLLATGGYACASRGLVVDKRDPYLAYKPAQAKLDQPYPYEWAYVRKWNTPMWWRAPTAEEYAATLEKQAILEAERTGVPLPGEGPPAGGTGGAAAGDGGGDEPAGDGGGDGDGDGDGDGGDGGDGGEPAGGDGATPTPTPPPTPPPSEEPPEEKEPVKIPLSPSTPWLEKGYFLSLGEELSENGRSYWRTARGGVVEKANAYPYGPKDFVGAEISEDMSFPVGFVMAKNGTKLLRLEDDNKLHATGKLLDKRTFLDLGEEVDVNGTAYFTVIPKRDPEQAPPAEGDKPEPLLLVKQDVMRLPDIQPMPKGLEPWDHWIDVDIGKQMLVAYEGTRPVYVTLVSTGKKGTNEEPFDTPTGRFRIYSKQVTSNMDGTTATDGNYAIQDVPWVMYFEGSYALHGAFWHQSFGYVRSHGCVNLGPSDARWLFMWSTPFLPEGWHGVKTSDENPGTTVVIRNSDK